MLKVVAKLLVKEDKVEEFIAVGKPLVEASKKDEGNIGYTLNVSVENPRQFAIIENWRDKEALDAHMQQDHFKEATAKMAGLAEGEMTIELFAEV